MLKSALSKLTGKCVLYLETLLESNLIERSSIGDFWIDEHLSALCFFK